MANPALSSHSKTVLLILQSEHQVLKSALQLLRSGKSLEELTKDPAPPKNESREGEKGAVAADVEQAVDGTTGEKAAAKKKKKKKAKKPTDKKEEGEKKEETK